MTEHVWDFPNDWCVRCGKTAEQIALAQAPTEILPGIQALTPDGFHSWSRQHGVRWEPVGEVWSWPPAPGQPVSDLVSFDPPKYRKHS